ncbi:MAG: branched-chain amino acid ABC transporter permease [Acetobacteraceae bacterium]
MSEIGLGATLLQFLASGLVIGMIYGLAAIAYTTIFNVTGVINFAQGDMATIPALTAITLYDRGWGQGPALLGAMALGGAIAAGIERVVVAPLAGSVIRTTVATIGVGIVLQGTAVLVFGTEARTLPSPLGGGTVALLGIALPLQAGVIFGATVVLVFLLGALFQMTYLGRAFRACAMNPYAAGLSGIDVGAMRTLAFVLSGFVAAVIGVLVAPLTLMQYDTGIAIGIKGFVACIIGGLGNPLGAIAGGLLLGVLESYATWIVGSGYKSAISLSLLIGFLLLRPGGLLGALERLPR